MRFTKTPEEQAAAQAAHCRDSGETLPLDVTIGGRRFTQHFRSHKRGGRVVLCRNSKPGEATGHKFVVYQVTIDLNGREQLGQCVATTQSLSAAQNIASKP